MLTRLDVVQLSLNRYRAPVYLEIGVRDAVTFSRVRATRKIAVDPYPEGRRQLPSYWVGGFKAAVGVWQGATHVRTTSDEFFDRFAPHAFGRRHLSVCLVDGLHTFEQSLRDTLNALAWMAERPGAGIVVLHDCRPRTRAASLPSRVDAVRTPGFAGAWNGDVYRTIVHLRARRDDLFVCTLDTDEGLGVVIRGEPENMLDLADSDIAGLEFSDLDRNASNLLNLKPAEHVLQVLDRLA